MTRPVLLVTGASSGIGAATARAAADRGWRLVLVARTGPALEALAAELGGRDVAVSAPCDVGDWDQVRVLPEVAVAAFGRLDAVFANAAAVVATSFRHGTGTPEQWRELVLTNVYGTAITVRATLPALIAARGHLLLTGSVAGQVTVPGQLYSVTKWAVTALARSLRAELVTTGVRTTLIAPGLTDSGVVSPDRAADPMLRPDDVARAVLYALDQPPEVDVNEIVIRPTGQDQHR